MGKRKKYKVNMYTPEEYIDIIDLDFECEKCGHTCDMKDTGLTDEQECICPACGHIDGESLIN